ncbi:MAG: hypothetical protein KatS3mg003_0720 [Candidatus Nitrosocaldaceae archaeon]|nr:MAG: hypothetical protein KatS3mg003_0720 [Candidatus Nitrosocaldaceae archaeon]
MKAVAILMIAILLGSFATVIPIDVKAETDEYQFLFKIPDEPTLTDVRDVAVDDEGNIYALVSNGVVKFDSNGNFLFEFGSYGDDDGEFDDPREVAYDPNNNRIIVADTYNDRIQVFDSNGNFLFEFGSYGDDDGEFDDPRGVAYDPNNNRIIVADTYNQRIQVFDSNGNFLFEFGSYGDDDGEFDDPTDVTYDPNNNRIIVADRNNNRIQVFDSNGNFIKEVNSFDDEYIYPDSYPERVAYDPNHDRIIVADVVEEIYMDSTTLFSRIVILDSNGNFIKEIDYSDNDVTEPIAYDPNHDRIIVADSWKDRIEVFDSNGNFLFEFGSYGDDDGEFDDPRGVAYDPNNNRIIVADTHNKRIQVFDSNGNFLFKFGSYGYDDGEFLWPEGVAYDPNNNRIIVADSNNDRIQVFDSNGNFLFKFGSEGSNDGEFDDPRGVAYDPNNNRIIVADSNNDRIQVFDSNGNFLFEFGSYGDDDGEFIYPNGVAYDPNNDRIIVADTNNKRIQVFDSNGNFLFKFGSFGSDDGEFIYPNGVAYDPNNDRIIVADSNNDRIQVFDSNGNFLFKFGSFGSDDGEFIYPNGVAYDPNNDRIIVADTNNHRIQVFGKIIEGEPINGEIISYTPNQLTTINVNDITTIAATIKNTGNTPFNFIVGYSIWDNNGKIVKSDYKYLGYDLAVNDEATVAFNVSFDKEGDYWLQFGIWKDVDFNNASNLLDREPSPSQMLIRVITDNNVMISIPEGAANTINECKDNPESNLCYDPAILIIKPGTTVTWINNDDTSHTVTSGVSPIIGGNGVDDIFDSGIITSGAIFSYIFDKEGEYPYYCALHPWMIGKIIVTNNIDDFPTVDAFDVNPKYLALDDNQSFEISYSVSDDNGLKRVELWIAKDKNGEPDHSTWDFAKDGNGNNIIKVLNGEKSYNGVFTHKPKEIGAYWYGIHVVDNYVDDVYKDGHCNDESNSKCGIESTDNKAIRVILAEQRVNVGIVFIDTDKDEVDWSDLSTIGIWREIANIVRDYYLKESRYTLLMDFQFYPKDNEFKDDGEIVSYYNFKWSTDYLSGIPLEPPFDDDVIQDLIKLVDPDIDFTKYDYEGRDKGIIVFKLLDKVLLPKGIFCGGSKDPISGGCSATTDKDGGADEFKADNTTFDTILLMGLKDEYEHGIPLMQANLAAHELGHWLGDLLGDRSIPVDYLPDLYNGNQLYGLMGLTSYIADKISLTLPAPMSLFSKDWLKWVEFKDYSKDKISELTIHSMDSISLGEEIPRIKISNGYMWFEYHNDNGKKLLNINTIISFIAKSKSSDYCQSILVICYDLGTIISLDLINNNIHYSSDQLMKHYSVAESLSNKIIYIGNEGLTIRIKKVTDDYLQLKLDDRKIFSADLDSPGELRVYDSQGRVTGLVNNTIVEEIPNSFYDPTNEAVVILNATDNYITKVVGNDTSTYNLIFSNVDEQGKKVEIKIDDIPTNPNEVHQYNINFNDKSYEQKIDNNGDGIFEEVINNKAPTAIIQSSNYTLINKPIIFNASNSYDDNEIIEYIWNFGDNTTATGKIVEHKYNQTGTYLVTLTVKDNNNAIDTTIKIIDVYTNFTLNVYEGWNMISIPLEPIDNIEFDGYLYTWNATDNNYILADKIEPYKGYWLLSFTNDTINIIGKPITSIDIELDKGWHMIGSVYDNATLSFDNNNGYNMAYTWDAINNNYILTDKIEAGKGYWILLFDRDRVRINNQ